jgi:hypothetical protein
MLSSMLDGVVGDVTIEVRGMPPDVEHARGCGGGWPVVMGEGVMSVLDD